MLRFISESVATLITWSFEKAQAPMTRMELDISVVWSRGSSSLVSAPCVYGCNTPSQSSYGSDSESDTEFAHCTQTLTVGSWSQPLKSRSDTSL